MWIKSNYVQEYTPVRQCFRMAPAPWLKRIPKKQIGFLLPWQVIQINNYIDENMTTRIRVCDLAKICRLSTNYFSQVFANTFGYSPHAYLIERRLSRVQQILRTTDRSLSEVALECGFADQPHLTRLFRQMFGTTPGEWRRQFAVTV